MNLWYLAREGRPNTIGIHNVLCVSSSGLNKSWELIINKDYCKITRILHTYMESREFYGIIWVLLDSGSSSLAWPGQARFLKESIGIHRNP